MPKWSADGLMVPTCLHDAALLHVPIKPVCACGHVAVFDPHGLWWHFERHHWDDRLPDARKRFWCIVCKSRNKVRVAPLRLEFARREPITIVLPWPPDHEWKEAARRVR